MAKENLSQTQAAALVERRAFLRGLGKWSVAAISAAAGGLWLTSAPNAQAGWINRRGGGGGWINGAGYRGGGWINGAGGGGWVNRRYYGGGGSWVNRY